MSERLVLWWLPLSHYNEKVIWYLDLRRLPHVRRSSPAFVHIALAFTLTRGRGLTLPVMTTGTETWDDSVAIVAALEARAPSGLVPEDPAARARVLELERYFGDGLGVQARHLLHHYNTRDAETLDAMIIPKVPGGELLRRTDRPRAAVRALAGATLRGRFGIGSQASAEHAHATIVAACDRIESELAGGDYLVGDRFTLADLTGAALLYPLARPANGPCQMEHSPAFREVMEPLDRRRAFQWAHEIYARHRGDGVAVYDRFRSA